MVDFEDVVVVAADLMFLLRTLRTDHTVSAALDATRS